MSDSAGIVSVFDTVTKLEKIKQRHLKLKQILSVLEGKSETHEAILLLEVIRQVENLDQAET